MVPVLAAGRKIITIGINAVANALILARNLPIARFATTPRHPPERASGRLGDRK
jgi:hypothetical protein